MISRHRAREIALQILYQYELTHPDLKDEITTVQNLIFDLRKYYEHFKVPEKLQEFVGQLVAGSLTHRKDLDQIVEKHAANWKLSRMSPVDRSLLRMAIFEMLHLTSTPRTIVINEAIELAKQFGTSETPSFINGILDQVKVETPQAE